MRSPLQSIAHGFALAGAAPLLILSVVTASLEAPRLFDPCFRWQDTGGHSPYAPQEMRDCGGRTGGTSESRLSAIARLLLVQGSAFCAAVLALKGSYRYRRKLTLAASLILFALSVPLSLGTSGLITLVCGLCFLLSYLFSVFLRASVS
jgi:lysylphosphatidylglycerol synthetase-like protein (DUF2156 family)